MPEIRINTETMDLDLLADYLTDSVSIAMGWVHVLYSSARPGEQARKTLAEVYDRLYKVMDILYESPIKE